MLKNMTKIAAFAMAAALVGQPAQAATCTADASYANHWEGRRAGDADWTVKFRVNPSCEGSCSGAIEFRLHYRAPSGRSFSESNIVTWRSPNGRAIEATDEVESSLCDEIDDPCEFVDVEIRRVNCYD